MVPVFQNDLVDADYLTVLEVLIQDRSPGISRRHCRAVLDIQGSVHSHLFGYDSVHHAHILVSVIGNILLALDLLREA